MASLDRNSLFEMSLNQHCLHLQENIPLFEKLLKVMESAGEKDTSLFRVIAIETERIRSGKITAGEVPGFEYLVSGLLREYLIEIKTDRTEEIPNA